MTHREIGEYIHAQSRRRTERFKEKAILLDGLFRQWAATQAKHPKALSVKQLYPALFEEKHIDPSNTSPQERNFLSAQRWRSFLGV